MESCNESGAGIPNCGCAAIEVVDCGGGVGRTSHRLVCVAPAIRSLPDTITQKREYFANYGTSRSWVTLSLPEMGGTQTWESELVPIRIDVREGNVYAIGSPHGIKQFRHYQAPRHYIVAFKWANGGFTRIPLLEVPESIRREENVFPCIPDSKSKILTLAVKDLHWCEPSGDRWKFGKTIKFEDYEALAMYYARLENTLPQSE
jgi:hypothetical protein